MDKKVEIYSTPWCVYCKMTREYFKKNNIEYTDYDVSSDAAKRQEMIDKTHQMGVPVILIDGEIIIGFDRERIDKLLGIK